MSAVLVAVTDFGSVWRWRFCKNRDDPYRFGRVAYFNTTGVQVGNEVRQRPKITGYARFNGRSGFDPNRLSRMIDRVFECAEPCVWQGENKLLFMRRLSAPHKPNLFLVVLRNATHGTLKIGSQNWRSADTWLIAFSEYRDKQEAMLLMPAHGWIETELGRLVLHPLPQRPWAGRLILVSASQETKDALLERLDCAQPNWGLSAIAASAAVNVHHARSTVRIHAVGVLRNVAQRVQQPCAAPGQA